MIPFEIELKVWDATLSKLYHDWLDKWTFHEIDQLDVALQMQGQ